MDDMRKLGAKPQLEAQIHELEQQSRGWFEDDADFKARCDVIAAAAARQVEKAQKAAASTSSRKSDPSQWETVSRGKSGGKRR